MKELPRLAPDLPYPLIGLVPSGGRRVGGVGKEAVRRGIELVPLFGEPVRGVQQLAVDVELPLVPRSVPNSNGTAVAPAGQVRQGALREVVLSSDAEHDLQVDAPR